MQEQLLEAQQKASLMRAFTVTGGELLLRAASGDLRPNITIDPEAGDPQGHWCSRTWFWQPVNDALESAVSGICPDDAVTGPD